MDGIHTGAGFGSFGSIRNTLMPSQNNLRDWLKIPTTDGKTLTNVKGTDATVTGINRLDFDGSNDEITLTSIPLEITTTGVFEIEMDILIDDTDTSYQRVIWFYTSGNGFIRLQKNDGANTYVLWARNSSSNDIFKSSDISFTADTLYNLKITGDGTNVVVQHDGSTVATLSINSSNFEALTYNDLSFSNSTFALDGNMSNIKMTGGTTLHTHLPLQEGSGTVAYDVSGNGNNGTISGATWGTMNSIASWNLLNGFRSISGVKIPALNFKSTQVLQLDGANDEINTGYNPSGDLVIDTRVVFHTTSGDRCIHSCNGNTGYFFRVDDGAWDLYVGGGFVFNDASFSISTNVAYDTRLEYTASSNAWVAKAKLATDTAYTTIGSGTRTPTFSSSSVIIGQKGTSNYFDGEIHSFKLTDGGLTKVEYDCQSSIGTTTVTDSSGNSNNGTLHNTTLDDAWGKRIADSDGKLVPANYYQGFTVLSNPSGYVHNGCECGLDLIVADLTSANIQSVDNSTSERDYVKRVSSELASQILQYDAGTLNAAQLTRTRRYVG